MEKNNFDIIRFLLASIVLFRHNVDLSQNSSLKPLTPLLNSHYSVAGFFVISGFLIWRSFSFSKSKLDYIKKRARRLLPAYLFFVLVATCALSLMSTLTAKEYFLSFYLYKYLICNMFFLNFLQPCLPGVFTENLSCAVNGALWTIKVEVLFYMIVPLLFFIVNRSKKKSLLLILIYVLSIFYKYLLESFDSNTMYILSKQTPGFMSYFVVGISFYYFFNFYYKNMNILLILSFMMIYFDYNFQVEILTPFAIGCIVFFFAYRFSYFNNFGKYGDFSYGIYIYHFAIIQVSIANGMFIKHNAFVVVTCIFSVVLFLAVLSWYFIEKPFVRKRNVADFSCAKKLLK